MYLIIICCLLPILKKTFMFKGNQFRMSLCMYGVYVVCIDTTKPYLDKQHILWKMMINIIKLKEVPVIWINPRSNRLLICFNGCLMFRRPILHVRHTTAYQRYKYLTVYCDLDIFSFFLFKRVCNVLLLTNKEGKSYHRFRVVQFCERTLFIIVARVRVYKSCTTLGRNIGKIIFDHSKLLNFINSL